MNPLAAISKNLRELEASYGKIRTEETREKVDSAIQSLLGRIWPMEPPSVSAASVEGSGVSLTVTLGADQDAPQSVSVGAGEVLKETWANGVTTVYPSDYEEPAIEGDVNGTSGTFYAETVTSVVPTTSVNEIGGWPEYSQVRVIGLFPNRRSLKGTLPDGRTVHVERKMDWKVGEIRGRLVRAGASALYRTMA